MFIFYAIALSILLFIPFGVARLLRPLSALHVIELRLTSLTCSFARARILCGVYLDTSFAAMKIHLAGKNGINHIALTEMAITLIRNGKKHDVPNAHTHTHLFEESEEARYLDAIKKSVTR